MRKLTTFEIKSIEFKTSLTSMNVEGIGEGKTKYQFTIELQRISFDCDRDYLGKCNERDGKQTGYAIILKKENESVEAVFTECFESEAFTALGAYAGSVYMYNTLADTYIRGYTKIQL